MTTVSSCLFVVCFWERPTDHALYNVCLDYELGQTLVNMGSCITLDDQQMLLFHRQGHCSSVTARAFHGSAQHPVHIDAQQLQTFTEILLSAWHSSKCFQVLTRKPYEGVLLLSP